MPAIIVNDYTWRQNHEAVVVTTRLVGHPNKIDLFAVDNYLKASYPPFILELFLWGAIIEESSECTIGDETAVFTLKKQEIGVEWPSLLMGELDRDKKRAQRSRALEIARVSAEKREKARVDKRQVLQRQAVRAQIDLDTLSLNKIEAMRDSHRREAMRDFEEWRNRSEKPILENVTGTVQENRKAYRQPLKWFNDDRSIEVSQKSITDLRKHEVAISEAAKVGEDSNEESVTCEKTQVDQEIDSKRFAKENTESENEPGRLSAISGKNRNTSSPVESRCSSDSSSSDEDSENTSYSAVTSGQYSEETDARLRREYLRRRKKERENRGDEIVRRVLSTEKTIFLGKSRDGIFDENEFAVPRPRKSCNIEVKFTERQFPTPARESHHLEEQEWLEKQAEARRKSGFVSEDLRPEEQDPQWLKDKGDDFFKAGNYLGAISAYTHGIKLSEKMSSLYVNRSAAHYAAENYRRCAEDCSTALELMVPKCEGNRDSRARCHARLGSALCKLSAPQHGIPELEAALKLAPENDTIKRDLQMAKRYFDLKD